MRRFSDNIKNFTGPNPFSDSQARNFSDMKVIGEFYPISQFWTLFNDQHEILMGTRGSGKTFLLKMMRYSMLKKIDSPQAKKLVQEKQFIGLYVPMHLEFVAPFNDPNLSEENQINFFQFGFNCILAEALITELKSILEDIEDKISRAKKMVQIVEYIHGAWFGEEDQNIYDFEALSNKVIEMFYNVDWNNHLENVPVVFKRQICAPLLMTKMKIKKLLELEQEPTWIVCVDEAEFLNDISQKCINNVFRSDSNRIALKVATLPYYHRTLDTLVTGVSVANGNDFSFRVVDMRYDSADFIALTNRLCENRLKQRYNNDLECLELESFLGTIGNDDLIDYYRELVGADEAKKEVIEQKIIDNFPPTRKENSRSYPNKRKTIYDKYAPIFFVREAYKLSKPGNCKSGWFAGARNIRKLSQGNPRIYIQIMHDLFEKARKTELTTKAQHEVVMGFSKEYCESTQALEKKGPVIHKELNKIAEYLHKKVHNDVIRTTGIAFVLKWQSEAEFEEGKKWLELAVAYSRVIVDEETKIYGIKKETKYMLANSYAIAHWLPIRSDSPEKIELFNNEDNKYVVKRRKKIQTNQDWEQLSLFEEVLND